MSKQETLFIKSEIERLEKLKMSYVDELIGKCEVINHEIKRYKNMLKEKR